MLTSYIFNTVLDWEFLENVSTLKSNKVWKKTLEGKDMFEFYKTLELGILFKIIN